MANKTSHQWHFFRAGGFDQVQFKSGDDLRNLAQLDQKLWAALACPTRGLEVDPITLDLIDTDRDGRIRSPEVIAAVEWACNLLKDPGDLLKGSNSLPLAAINVATPEGGTLHARAKQILALLGKPEATAVGVEDIHNSATILSKAQFNGDGIVPIDSAPTDSIKTVIADIVMCLGGDADRGGQLGVTQAKLDVFFESATAFSAWHADAEKDGTVRPFGEATASAHAAYLAVKPKIDDFFSRCRLAAFDPRAAALLNRQENDYILIASKDMTFSGVEVAGFPLARIEAGSGLPLKSGLNPAWAGAVAAFDAQVVNPWLGERNFLTEADWVAVGSKFAPFEAWLTAKAGHLVEKLGTARVRDILAGGTKQSIAELISKDKALDGESAAIASLEKLVRFNRDLVDLLRNFVNFRDFYSRDKMSTFQAGTLYIDGRACELCIPVDDPGKHAALAGMAKTFLAYCQCARPGGEKLTIAAGFTGGDSDNLMVGRNGIFYDRKGRDWDATITKLIENPISIRQAFWAPHKKLVRMIEEQVAKRASAAESESNKKLGETASLAANVDKAQPPKSGEPKKVDVGTVAALGVAVGAIGTFLTAVVGYITGLFDLPFWQLVLAVGGIVLAISTPSMLIAWLKLRQRNLGPILDANGWAINGRVRMNVPFGGSLTQVAALPPGARAALDDPFAEKPAVWPKFALFLVALGFVVSLIAHVAPVQVNQWTRGLLGKKETQSKPAQETNMVEKGSAPAGP